MKQTRRSGNILGNKPDLYRSPLSLKGISCWTKQTSSKVTVEQSAVGIYESVTRHWNQSQDTRNTLTLKPVTVNSELLDSNKEGYLLVSNGEGYLLVSHRGGYLLVSHTEGTCWFLTKKAPAGFSQRRHLLVSHKEGTCWFLTKKGTCWFLTKKSPAGF
ncbi:hypothetical protein F511_26000 [Dorcoceras hygrometricum]|uniref:Uncharacterized protein n=1 Tax=Dorcoceras hygrometricum TaxID=472368 RepID=A0A2Z7C992_9LAMI|nr:hypothetical protein F511_26000 [Dorcoceras hygrometricum]